MTKSPWALLVSLSMFACNANNTNNTSSAPSATMTAEASSVATAKPSAQPAVEYKDEDLPVAADFEEEAEKSITLENYKDEIEKIEKELGVPDKAPMPKPGH